MEYIMPVVEVMTVINYSNRLLSVIDEKILSYDSNRNKSDRFSSVYNEQGLPVKPVRKVNPSLDINALRERRTSIRSDIIVLEDLISEHNASFKFSYNGKDITIFQAFKEIKTLEQELSYLRKRQSQDFYFVVESEEVEFDDIDKYLSDYVSILNKIFILKTGIMDSNSKMYSVEIKSSDVSSLVL